MTQLNRKALTAGQAEDAAVQLQHDMVAIVREEIGMHESIATVFASALVRGLRRNRGGEELYIPAPDRTERDAAIRREFDGNNLEKIMAKHNVKRTRVYEICGRRDPKSLRTDATAKNPLMPLETGQP
jgi:Mor family transcriptional regulator